MVPDLVRVAAAAQVTRQSDGVRQTILQSLSHGVAITYRDNQVVPEALGSGATVLTFGGAQRQMLPGPVGDLETARLASGAANVVAYIANPTARARRRRIASASPAIIRAGARPIRETHSPYAATAIVLSAGVRLCGAGWCAGPGAVYDL